MRRLPALLAALALALGLAVGAPAAAHADNTAIAVNTKDGSSVFKFAFAVRHVMSSVVDEVNSAVAYSSCTDCHTTAIAIEIVLVEGSPTTFTPTNQAIAINYQCTLCETFASAYQFVVQGSGPMHFTSQGYRDLHDIRRAIRDLRRQTLSPFELQAALDPLIERLKYVLANELVPGRPPDEEGDNQNQDQSNGGQAVPQHEGGQTTTTTGGPQATATETAPTTSTSTTPQATTGQTTTTPTTSTSTTPTTTSTTPTTTTGTTTTTP